MDFNPPPAGGPDGALTWYNQSLAKVLGLNPADPALPAELLSELSTQAQRKAISAVIDRRFKRVLDSQTGAVTIDQVGFPLALAEPDVEGDPVVGNLAEAFLGAAADAVAAVDSTQCVPGTCADTIAAMLAQIRSTIDQIRAEARSRGSPFLMSMHLNELTDDYCGLVPRLIELLKGPAGSAVGTVGREQAVSSLRIARRALGCFEEAARDARGGCDEEPTLAEQAEIVRSCGANVIANVQSVRSALASARISDFELRSIEVDLGSCVQLGDEAFDKIPFDQLLHVLESEMRRWLSLIAGGQRSGFDSLGRSAETLRLIVKAINSGAILTRLGFVAPKGGRKSEPREAIAGSLGFQIDRMRAFALFVLDTILCDPADGKPPRAGGGTPSKLPSADAQSID